MIQQGFICNGGLTSNAIAHRISSSGKVVQKEDVSVVETYGNTFSFPLEHALLHQPFLP